MLRIWKVRHLLYNPFIIRWPQLKKFMPSIHLVANSMRWNSPLFSGNLSNSQKSQSFYRNWSFSKFKVPLKFQSHIQIVLNSIETCYQANSNSRHNFRRHSTTRKTATAVTAQSHGNPTKGSRERLPKGMRWWWCCC